MDKEVEVKEVERVMDIKKEIKNAIDNVYAWDLKLLKEGEFRVNNVLFKKLLRLRKGGGRGDLKSIGIVEVDKNDYLIAHFIEYSWDEVDLSILKLKDDNIENLVKFVEELIGDVVEE